MVQFYSAFCSTLAAFSATNVAALNNISAFFNQNVRNGKECSWRCNKNMHVEIEKNQTTSKSLNFLRLTIQMNGED